jgi:hypothetical protein
MAKPKDEARKKNTYKKPSGVKVTVPSRNVDSKQTRASEETLGRAQDTGKGKGPLRGTARRSREGMELMSDAAMKKKYPSQNVSGARGKSKTEGKIGPNGKLVPAKTVPVKPKGGRGGGGLAGGIFGTKNR